ncbi:MAG: o-succinylbenzoate synthase [Propionibacteriaceae bacterium]
MNTSSSPTLPPWCDHAVVFDLPMRVTFRGITRRHGMLLHGEYGWAEWSPFTEYDLAEAATWLAAAHEAATCPPVHAVRELIPVNVTIPAVGPEQAHALVRESACTTAKVKVAGPGSSLRDDLARVEAVRDALGPHGKIRCDANGCWSRDEALSAIKQLACFELEYVEQPVLDVADLATLRRALAQRGIDVRIAADESIRRVDDPYRVKALHAADVAVIKVQPLGGVRAALRIAEDLGLPTVISSALDSSVGLRLGVSLAAALPELPFACGLNTSALFETDVTALRVIEHDGSIALGSPLDIDPADVPLADTATTAWWLERLAAAALIEQDRVR